MEAVRYKRTRCQGWTAFTGRAGAPLEVPMSEWLMALLDDLPPDFNLCEVDTGFIPPDAYYGTSLCDWHYVPRPQRCLHWWRHGRWPK